MAKLSITKVRGRKTNQRKQKPNKKNQDKLKKNFSGFICTAFMEKFLVQAGGQTYHPFTSAPGQEKRQI